VGESCLPSSSEWTSALTSNIDDLLNSLQPQATESLADSLKLDPSSKAASPESEWFAGLTEQEQRVM
jgi:hypothetical protein